MNTPVQFDVSDLLRRIENLLKVGVIHEVDLDAKKLRVKMGDIITGWLNMPGEVTANYIRWRPLKTGTQVLVASESADPANAIIVQILYTADNQPVSTEETLDIIQFNDGTAISYNTATSALTAALASNGHITATAPQGIIDVHSDQGTINVTAQDGEINVHADNGTITATADDGSITARSNRGLVDISANFGELKAFSNNGHVHVSADQGVIDVTANQGTINLDTQGGKINATCLQGFDITGDVSITGSLSCTGNANVDGDIDAGGDISADGNVSDTVRSMVADRVIYNSHGHANNGIAPPVPQQ